VKTNNINITNLSDLCYDIELRRDYVEVLIERKLMTNTDHLNVYTIKNEKFNDSFKRIKYPDDNYDFNSFKSNLSLQETENLLKNLGISKM